MPATVSATVSALLLASLPLLANPASAELVNVYTSANFPPLMLGDGRGVYPDMIAYLNRQQIGDLTFKLHYLPRKRLQLKLERDAINGVVIGMMPAWLNDLDQKKYLWTAPFATDSFALVSLKSRPCKTDAMGSASVGVTMGYVYPGIDAWLAGTSARRREGFSDQSNIEKVLLARIDCAIVATSMARYFSKFNKLDNKLTLQVLPGAETERRFVVPHRYGAVYKQFAPLIERSLDSAEWRRIAAQYE